MVLCACAMPETLLLAPVPLYISCVLLFVAGIKDGQPISEADQLLLISIVVSAFNDVEGAADMVRAAVSDAGREGRKTANA